MIIAFCGPDGAGKSTQSRLVAYLFKRIQHKKVAIVRLRSHHFAMYLLIRLLQLLKVIPNMDSPREFYTLIRYKLFKMRKVLAYLEMFNDIVWILFNVYIRNLLGYIIVAERFIPDTIVTLSYEYGVSILNSYVSKILLSFFINRSQHLIYLHAPNDVLLHRKKYERLSFSYLRIMKRLYITVLRQIIRYNNKVEFTFYNTATNDNICYLTRLIFLRILKNKNTK